MTVASPDVIDELAGLDAEQSAALRGHRPDVIATAQASYDALLPADLSADPVPGLDLPTRLLIAARAAQLEQIPTAVAHYAARLADHPELVTLAVDGPNSLAGRDASRRHRAILRQVELLVIRPAATTSSDLGALGAAGLDEAQIVVASQVAAFVSFQVRVAHGLIVLKSTLSTEVSA